MRMVAYVKENKKRIFKVIVALVFPFLGCIIYCMARGISFLELYLPNSINNDVLFYYKLVEGMVNGGITGYFGFNESHAVYGGFAAWNPLIVMPWFVWGKLFGWGYMAPIVSNIILFALSLGIYVFLVNPKWKSLVAAFLIFLLFPGLWIHLLNGLPEIIIASNLIIFMALMIAYEETRKKSFLWIAILCSAYLSVVRPYMVIFLIYALVCLIMHKRWLDCMLAFFTYIFVGLVYFFVNHFYTAAYFEPLYDVSFFKALLGLQFKQAYYEAGTAFKNTVPGVLKFLSGTFSFGSTAGTQYFIAIFGVAYSAIWIAVKRGKREMTKSIFVSYVLTVSALLAAIILLLGKANEGGRHCFAFAVVAIILLSVSADSVLGIFSNGVLAILLIVFICRGAMVPTDYDIPAPNNKLEQEVEYWKATMPSSVASGYDNTVIWALSDTVNGSGMITNFHGLYGMPASMGINCCNYPYLIDNIGSLKSKYIAVTPDGYFSENLCSLGYKEIGRTDSLVVYATK